MAFRAFFLARFSLTDLLGFLLAGCRGDMCDMTAHSDENNTDARGYGPTVQALAAWAGSGRHRALSAAPGGRHLR